MDLFIKHNINKYLTNYLDEQIEDQVIKLNQQIKALNSIGEYL